MAQELIENQSAWEKLGGTDGGAPEAFAALVDAFYDGVAEDALLRPMYPAQSDLKEERENLALFLIQYFGGQPSGCPHALDSRLVLVGNNHGAIIPERYKLRRERLFIPFQFPHQASQ